MNTEIQHTRPRMMRTFLRQTHFSLILAASLLVFTGTVAAETGYVSDTLRVGVRPAPNSHAAPIGVAKSGMRLEILESSDGYVRIRTEGNLEGWVRDTYVVKAPPAMVKLETLQQRQNKLQNEVKALRDDNQVLQEANRVLNQRLDQLSAERAKWQLSEARAALADQDTSWLWWLLGILMIAGAGFYSGISWYRQSVMKRLGGLRI
jgi:uncharacterized protein YgiM (DUF1202 family)